MQRKFCLTCLCNILPKSCWSLQFPLAPATCRSREVGGDRREQRSQLLSPPCAVPAPVGALPVTLLPPPTPSSSGGSPSSASPRKPQVSRAAPNAASSSLPCRGEWSTTTAGAFRLCIFIAPQSRTTGSCCASPLHPLAEKDGDTETATSPSPSMQRKGSTHPR